MLIVDGDTHNNNKLKEFIQNDNVLILPTNTPPDKLIYEYLCETTNENNFNEESGFTQRYVKVKGPATYTEKTEERQKYSSWFHDNLERINDCKCFENWCEEHSDECTDFINDFINKYSIIAKKTTGRMINNI